MKERLDQEESFQCKAPGQVGHSTPDSDVENFWEYLGWPPDLYCGTNSLKTEQWLKAFWQTNTHPPPIWAICHFEQFFKWDFPNSPPSPWMSSSERELPPY